MPLPSACSVTTLRSGHATAAPVASGRPMPMAPPVSMSQSCGALLTLYSGNSRPWVMDSSHTMACSGKVCATRILTAAPVSLPLAGTS